MSYQYEKHGEEIYRQSFSIILREADLARFSALEERVACRMIHAAGMVELASHTYNLHNPQYGGLTAPDGINGIQRLKGESQAAYNKRVGEDLKQSIDLITQKTSQKNVLFFAYPFGARDAWMQPLLQKNGIQVSVLTNTGTASIRRGLTDLPRYRITMDS